mgnify:CR=1 FL=1
MTGRKLDAEQKLEAFFATSRPAAQDYEFEIAVLERIAKHRAVARFSQIAMLIVALGGTAIAMIWGAFSGQAGALAPLVSAVGGMAVAGLVIWTLGRAAPA